MHYEKSKIYKLQCDDGYYYFGSTRNDLNKRLYDHKRASLKHIYRVYQHINTIGWERVSVVLVEEYSCSSRKDLLQKESEYISANIYDTFCLNTILAYVNEDQRLQNKRKLHCKYKDKLALYHKEKRGGNPEVAEYQRQYREKNKEDIKLSKKSYYDKNKDDINKKKLEKYYANKDEILTRKREKYNKLKHIVTQTT